MQPWFIHLHLLHFAVVKLTSLLLLKYISTHLPLPWGFSQARILLPWIPTLFFLSSPPKLCSNVIISKRPTLTILWLLQDNPHWLLAPNPFSLLYSSFFSSYSHHLLTHYVIYLFIGFVANLSPQKAPQKQWSSLSFKDVSQGLEQCSTLSRCSINMFKWMNE